MKRLVSGICVVVIFFAFGQQTFAQDKKFQVMCGLAGSENDRIPPGDYPFPVGWFYRHLSFDADVTLERDFIIGVPVVLSIQNCSPDDTPLSIREGTVSWMDYVTITVKRVKLKTEGTTLIEEFLEPKSTYKVTPFAEVSDKDVLEDLGDIDGAWMLVEFDNPDALEEGRYVFFPKVDLEALSLALPDLNELEEPIDPKEMDFERGDLVLHKKMDLSTADGKKNAMNLYLVEADRMYGFGKEEKMQEYINEVFKINPNSAAAHATVAGRYLAEKNFDEALTNLLLAKGIAEAKSDTYVDDIEHPRLLQYLYKHIGLCHHRLGQYEDAEVFYVASIDMLKDQAFAPGPEISSHWAAEQIELQALVVNARNSEEPYEP